MKIAHLSDLHLLSLDGVPFRRFLNKRASGWVNLRVKRGAIHRASYVRAVLRAVTEAHVDHVFVTGVLPNLSLDTYFALPRNFLTHHPSHHPPSPPHIPNTHSL